MRAWGTDASDEVALEKSLEEARSELRGYLGEEHPRKRQ